MQKLLNELRGKEDRTAVFKTIIAFVTEDEKKLFSGEIRGRIAERKSGDQGFGYDPLFVPEDSNKTFAEMSMEEKGKENHRVRAFRKFIDFLKTSY